MTGVPVEAGWYDQVRFIDCGENFEEVRCPHCGALLLEGWQDSMDAAFESLFQDLRVTLPCCDRPGSLADLEYDWPQGFASFELRASDATDFLRPEALSEVEAALGTPLRQVLARY